MKNFISLFFISLILMNSCVSMKKYKELEAKYQKTDISDNSNERQLERLKTTNTRLEKEVQKLRVDNQRLQDDINLERDVNEKEKIALVQEIQKLKSSYSQLVENSTIESNIKTQNPQSNNNSNLITSNTPQNSNLNNINNPNPNKNQTLNTFVGKANNINGNLTYTNKNTFNTQAEELRQKISAALSSFPEEDIDISYQKDKVQLLIDDEVLFQESGKGYRISSEGKTILNNLSNILKSYPDIATFIKNKTLKADGNTSRYQKGEALSQYLQSIGLDSNFNEKNNAPIAFETSRTEESRAKTEIILRKQ